MSYRTAAQPLDKPPVTMQDGSRNEPSRVDQRDTDLATAVGSENVAGQQPEKHSILRGITEQIDSASSFGILLPQRPVLTNKKEDAATEESFDQ